MQYMRRESVKVALLNTLFIAGLIALYLANRSFHFLEKIMAKF